MKRSGLLVLLLLAACSNEAEQAAAPAVSDEPTISASAAAPPAALADPPRSAWTSRYTRFKDCKLVQLVEEEDWATSRCKGLGGYDLQIDYADARDDLVVLRRGAPPAKLGLFELGSGGFNTLSDTAEWRGHDGPDGFKPTRLIVRNQLSEDMANADKVTSILLVVDLQQGCVIGQVRPQAGQNEAARAIADGPQRPCLSK